ncbi:MAG: hypothetical protein MZU91_03200 [Desulfosudis oleivorans]|nr:hypothetical protein [Desulfosudis oleivorans]
MSSEGGPRQEIPHRAWTGPSVSADPAVRWPQELAQPCIQQDGAPTIVNYIAGLAGRDVSRKDFRNIILEGKNKARVRATPTASPFTG